MSKKNFIFLLILATALTLKIEEVQSPPPQYSKEQLEKWLKESGVETLPESERKKHIEKALEKTEFARSRLLKLGFSEEYVNNQTRFILGDYSPVILIHPLFGVKMRININCDLFQKNNLKDFVKLKLFCKEYVCSEPGEMFEDYLFITLNTAFSMNPEKILGWDNNQYSACLGYVWKFYNHKDECPEESCNYSDGVRISLYGLTENTYKESQCGISAATEFFYSGLGPVIDELGDIATNPFYPLNARLDEMGYTNGFNKGAVPYDFRKFVQGDLYFENAFKKMVDKFYENTGKKVVVVALSYGNNKVYQTLIDNPDLKNKIRSFVAYGPPFIGSAKLLSSYLYGYPDFTKKLGPIVFSNMHMFGQSLIFNTFPTAAELRPMPLIQRLAKNPKYTKFISAIHQLIKIEEECRRKDCSTAELESMAPDYYKIYKDLMPMLDEAECKINPKSVDDPDRDTEGDQTTSLWINPCRHNLYDYFNCPILVKREDVEADKTALELKNLCGELKKGYYVKPCPNEEQRFRSYFLGKKNEDTSKCLDKLYEKARYPYDKEEMDDLLEQFNDVEEYKSLLEPDVKKLEKTDRRYFESPEEFNQHFPKIIKKVNSNPALDLPIPPVDTYIFYANFRRTETGFLYDEKAKKFGEKDILYRGGDGTVNSFSTVLPGLKWLYDKQQDKSLTQNIYLVEFCSLLSDPKNKYSYTKWKEGGKKNPFFATYCNCINEDYTEYEIGVEKSDTCSHGNIGKDPATIEIFVEELITNAERSVSVEETMKKYRLKKDFENECNEDLYKIFKEYENM